MIKKLLILVLFVTASFSLIAAPKAVQEKRKQIVEREQARAYYTKKFQELQNQDKIFKKSLSPMKDKHGDTPLFSKKF